MMTHTGVEIVNSQLPRGPFRIAFFDFDGTLSMLREGWPEIMMNMMLGHLRRLELESAQELARLDELVMSLNGQPTIRQMQRFAADVRDRGGDALHPNEYLREYDQRLMAVVNDRRRQALTGRSSDWLVPGAPGFLSRLRELGVVLALASGTEVSHVRHEAELLGMAPYFGQRIFAPRDNDPTFTKRGVIERLLNESGFGGDQLIGFGDGVVETEEVKRVGGLAVAVASQPSGQDGVNRWKRDRLVEAGADVVIADYRCGDELLENFWGTEDAIPAVQS